MKVAHFTDRGKVRPVNEDNLLANETLGFFTVVDGVSSSGQGRAASELFTRHCRESLQASLPGPSEALPQIFSGGNRLLFKMSEEGATSVGAAAAALWVRGSEAHIAWVGDCRVYRYRGGRLDLLTRDHTRAQELIDRGALSPGRAPRKSALTRCLGFAPKVDVDYLPPTPVRAGDRFLICTDGVSDSLEEPDLVKILGGDVQDAGNALREGVLARGAEDNLTAILVDVEEADLDPKAWPEFSDVLPAARPTVDPASGEPLPARLSEAPRDLATFLAGVAAAGPRSWALEAGWVGGLSLVLFLVPSLLEILGQRLAEVSPVWFLAGGGALYVPVAWWRARRRAR